jgi:dihydroflavonol-4-reductase
MHQFDNLVLVTGATGFLGHSLCPILKKQGYQIRALVRPTSDHAFLERLGAELAFGDIRDAKAVEQAVQGCRGIVHAAGKFRFWGKREEFYSVNVGGTRTLLEAATAAQVDRFVYVSTIAVVGKPPSGEEITEQTPCYPLDAYQESKLEAERQVLSQYAEHRLPALILRPGAYYGPWGRYAFNRLFFEDPLERLPVLVRHGRHVIFPAYTGDVARAVDLALRHARPGEIYNICGECLTHDEVNRTVERLAGRSIRWLPVPSWGIVTLAQVWTWLSHLTRREPYYPIGLYPYVFYDWQVSIDKAQRELGFSPTPFEEGARRTLEWYWQQGIIDIGAGYADSQDGF